MKQKYDRYKDFLSTAQETQTYIWNVERYDPNGGVRTLSIMCTKEEYDAAEHNEEIRDRYYMSKLVENFAKELLKNV